MARSDGGRGDGALAVQSSAWRGEATLAWFAGTMLLGAFLVFSIQPLFARMALPLLGGAPAVWNTAMVFFQSALLAGYAYAHCLSRCLGPRGQVAGHLSLLAIASLGLPVVIGDGWEPPAGAMSIPWLIALMAWTVGLPFLAVAATAPLIQRWFADSGHPAAGDPYFLYGASNLGSILALLSYPLLVEPTLTLQQQGWLWAAGYGALALAITGCGLVVWRRVATGVGAAASGAAAPSEPIGWPRRLRWLMLALVPSSLLLAVTTHITTDLAAVPLLWVVPLALYLLTFVVAFARRPWLRHAWMIRAQPFVLIPLVLLFAWNLPFWLGLPLHLFGLFVSALVCHGELARLRPTSERLTEFYFWMAAGGALGGAFTALLAPLLFDGVFEYPIALVAACLLRPTLAPAAGRRVLDFALPIGIGILLAARTGADVGLRDFGTLGLLLVFVPSALALYALAERPLGFGLGIAAAMGGALLAADAQSVVARERSFFGVYTVKRDPAGYHVLLHGTTMHGAQRLDAERRRQPLTYFHRDGPLGQLFGAVGARVRNIGAVGLGVGTVACYRRPGQRWTFYEIDPLVERIARDRRHFHYLAECAPDAEIRTGDARLTLQGAPRAAYDLLILDAFSSDAIPMHLMTREALALYLDKLAPGGVIAWHVSNRNLDLAPIVADLAADAGVVAWVQTDQPSRAELAQYRTPSIWIALARRAEDLGPLVRDPRWQRLHARPDARPWTDDFSNILSALRWRLSG
ncbi:MAG TPA: fused MFS/spermidine synthase [Geminicoccaceae bacterium]|nr:fused MFS/spermidine synthase [Geminicoccaceae bacterium]